MKVLDSTGLSYLVNKIKASFAEKTHTHTSSDLTDTLPIEKGGTGGATKEEARESLGFVGLENDTTDATVWSDESFSQYVGVRSQGQAGDFSIYADEDGLHVYDHANQQAKQNYLPNSAATGLFRTQRGQVTDASWQSLYNLAPGSYIMSNSATNSPCPGSYGNVTVSRCGGNRVSIFAVFDNGEAWTIRGAQASDGKAGGWRQIPIIEASSIGSPATGKTWWGYRKYADGFCELYGRLWLSNYNFNSASGNTQLYFGSTLQFYFPFNVYWANVQVQIYKDPGIYIWNLKNIASNYFQMVMTRNGFTGNVTNIGLTVHVTGYWKDLGGWA